MCCYNILTKGVRANRICIRDKAASAKPWGYCTDQMWLHPDLIAGPQKPSSHSAYSHSLPAQQTVRPLITAPLQTRSCERNRREKTTHSMAFVCRKRLFEEQDLHGCHSHEGTTPQHQASRDRDIFLCQNSPDSAMWRRLHTL